jgi:NAD(P)H-dependent FMN reductase
VLRDKPVAVIGASPSPGGTARAQDHARKVLAAIGAQVLDAELLAS